MYRTHSDEEVERFMLKTRDALRASADDDPASLATVCNELGSLYRESGRYAESVENFDIALRCIEQIKGTSECEEYAVVLLNVAGTYRCMREFDEALSRYQTARDILTELGRDDGYEFASLLNNLSLTLIDTGRLDEALELARASHQIIVSLKPGEAQEAMSLVNLATLALRAGDMDTASTYSKQAIQIYSDLGTTSGHYPAAVNLAAVIDYKRGALEQALEGFERSAELTKRNFGENRDYASALVNIATVLERLGRSDEAREHLARAEKIRDGLA